MSITIRRTGYALGAAASVLVAVAVFHPTSADAAVESPLVRSKYFTSGATTITCPSGRVATGGGVGADLNSMYVVQTEPVSNSAGKPIGWKANLRRTNGAAGSGTIYVVCAR